ITETVPPEKLFSNYLYFSSFADTVVQNAQAISNRMRTTLALNKDNHVVEIASNDGYLLQHYQEHGISVLGIEPAGNIAEAARKRGIPTVNKFFNETVARQIRAETGPADVIHANNVVAHVADLHGVVAGIAALLKDDGIAVIENHYVKALIDHTEFDSIYHEHLCYYSATSFANLFKQHGLILVDVEHIPIHGGSLRVFFQRSDGPRSWEEAGGGARTIDFLAAEQRWGASEAGFYRDFGRKVARLKESLVSLLGELNSNGKSIAAYGASAKSTTLLNYCGVGAETIRFVADRSTVKQGLFTPGTHLPIVAPEELLAQQPDYVILLSWNFVDEIMKQQEEYRRRGGRF
ncbi:MAG TPA: class I SAM-dependent methyltransferase, partial [Oligoflexia bacterium]|nr:class I SAM-dependent methyltransferase [Oligoflexia bacterium]